MILDPNRHYTVTFTGGLGAQIISASAYFFLQHQTLQVSADLRYFSQTPKLAQSGRPGELSVWPWDLTDFGLNMPEFVQSEKQNSIAIEDGLLKLQLFELGVKLPFIREKFPVSSEAINLRTSLFGNENYTCVHVRRGDYLNVATLVVSEESIASALRKVSQITTNLLILSDTPLGETLKTYVDQSSCSCHVLVGGPASMAHGLMRLSQILIGTNSQLSYTAAALRGEDQLSFHPSLHDADASSQANQWINSRRLYQVW